MGLKDLERQLAERPVDEARRSVQGFVERIKGWLARGERCRVAHEFKFWVHAVTDRIGKVIEIERGQVARAILNAERTERPLKRVGALASRLDILAEGRKARSLGQEGSRGDAMRECRVPATQESHHRPDRVPHARELLGEVSGCRRQAVRWQLADRFCHRLETRDGEEPPGEGNRQVGLGGLEAARSQKAGQIGRGGIRRVELRHRRDDGKDARFAHNHEYIAPGSDGALRSGLVHGDYA